VIAHWNHRTVQISLRQVKKFLQENQLNAAISQIYFWNETLHVLDSSFVHHQEFFTVHTAMVYVIQVTVTACEQDQDGTSRIRTEPVPSWSCSQAVSEPVWHIPLLCIQWKTADDGQRNCPKCVEFCSKNKFEKLVHLVGFIIRIYHDARSPERQINKCVFFREVSDWVWCRGWPPS